MQNIQWDKLKFEFMPTRSNIRFNYAINLSLVIQGFGDLPEITTFLFPLPPTCFTTVRRFLKE